MNKATSGKISMLFFLLSGLIVLLALSTCYYDSEEYLYPSLNDPCDTTQITYSLSVKPILQNNCYSCHSNSTSSSGNNIRLEDYPDVVIRVNDGSLMGAMSHTGGFSPMPKDAAKLEDCLINVVQKWIDSGSPNN
jgi:hypothetical protein